MSALADSIRMGIVVDLQDEVKKHNNWLEFDDDTEYHGDVLEDGVVEMTSEHGTVRRFRILVEEIK